MTEKDKEINELRRKTAQMDELLTQSVAQRVKDFKEGWDAGCHAFAEQVINLAKTWMGEPRE